MSTHEPRHVVVVGGGIAGLTTAYELGERARASGQRLRVTLIEAAPDVGGKILTEEVASELGTFVVEGGPDSFLTQKPWAAQLCRRLGLDAELIPTNDARRAVFVVHRGRLERLPEGMQLIVPTRVMPLLRSRLFGWPGKLRMLVEPLIPPRRGAGDESLAAFVGRRFGREVVETLAEPLMSGIHAAQPEQQSLLGTWARYREMELTYGSLIRGTLAQRRAARTSPAANTGRPASMFLSLRGGLKQLVEALRGALHDVEVRVGERVISLEQGLSGYRLQTSAGTWLEADAVALATPAYAAGDLLRTFAPELAELLHSIRYVSTATVSLGYRRADIAHPLDGFGFVVPRREARRIFGCTWSSTKFAHRAPEQGVLVRCFVGGSGNEAIVEGSDAELLTAARDELRLLMGIDAEPVFSRVFRWRRSNPQYDVGHLKRVQSIYVHAAEHPGLFVTGSAYEGVGIPDCVRHAQQTAEKVLEYLSMTRTDKTPRTPSGHPLAAVQSSRQNPMALQQKPAQRKRRRRILDFAPREQPGYLGDRD